MAVLSTHKHIAWNRLESCFYGEILEVALRDLLEAFCGNGGP